MSYEPGAVVFPEGEVPPPIARADGMLVPAGNPIPLSEFMKLTRMPIQIVWGDYFSAATSPST